MDANKFLKNLEAQAGVKQAFALVLGISLLTNILLAGAYLTMDKSVRTIITPTEVRKTFWVEGSKLSAEYLEQMGLWVVEQYSTVTPSSFDYKSNLILKYVHPSVHGALSVRFKAGGMKLKGENMSRFFSPREVRINEGLLSVAFIGSLDTFIADKRAATEVKAYLVVFSFDGSNVTIKELRETSPLDPFAAGKDGDNQNSESQFSAPADESKPAVPAGNLPAQPQSTGTPQVNLQADRLPPPPPAQLPPVAPGVVPAQPTRP